MAGVRSEVDRDRLLDGQRPIGANGLRRCEAEDAQLDLSCPAPRCVRGDEEEKGGGEGESDASSPDHGGGSGRPSGFRSPTEGRPSGIIALRTAGAERAPSGPTATRASSRWELPMRAFDYAAPRTLEEAFALLEDGRQVRFLAGGTDILVQLREGRADCELLVDVKRIPALRELAVDDEGWLRIGAAVPCAELYEDARVRRGWPALVDAASLIGGTQIQSRATLGGNVCNASPAADSVPALLVLGARVVLASARGRRELPLGSFFRGPGQTVLERGEILTSILVPPQPSGSGARFLRFIPRNEMDIAVANAAAFLRLDGDGRIAEARVAVGAVAPTPLLVPRAAEALVGTLPGEEAFAQAAALAAEAARPITDVRGSAAQRRHLVRVLTVRALRGALARAQERR